MNHFDAIVIGGGPSGSTTGALLAEQGHRVLLLERETFPRYHIGESLIPYTWFTLNRLGVVDWLRRSACPKKYSVQFVSITGKVSQPFYFFKTIKHECAQTWQIWRGEFDQMLLDNAAGKGVEVRHHDQFGVPASAKEAVCFALLGYELLRNRPANLPGSTGATRSSLLGKLAPGLNFAPLLQKFGPVMEKFSPGPSDITKENTQWQKMPRLKLRPASTG